MRRDTLLATGLIVAFVAALVLIVGFAFIHGAAAVADDARTLALYRAELAERPRLMEELTALRTQQAAAPGLLQGTSAPLAAADMQRIVKSVIEGCDGEVRSAQNLPSSAQGGLERIEVRYDLVLPLPQLKRALYRLETSAPYLFLDNIDLKVPDGAEGERTVELQGTVHGYRGMVRS